MSVKWDATKEEWLADFTVNKKRIRQHFLVREEAREFERQAKITAKLGVSIANQDEPEGKALDEGIQEFIQLETSKKESAGDEKAFLAEFYHYLIYEEKVCEKKKPFATFPQIGLIHLSRHQVFLQDGARREACFQAMEAARKKEWEVDEAERKRKGQSSQPFVPTKHLRKFVGLSASSVNRHMNSIRDLLTWARRWKWIYYSPGADIEILEAKAKPQRQWPSDEKIQAAIDRLEDWAVRPIFLIAIYGLRPIGAKRMTWSEDVKMSERKFRIISKKNRHGSTKEQWLMMTDEVFEFFKFMWSHRQVGKYGDLVFHSKTGLPLDTKGLARELARVTSELGLKGCTLRGLRRFLAKTLTNPSKKTDRDGNIEHARQLLGHATVEQTKVYNDTDDSDLLERLNKVSAERNIGFRGELVSRAT